MATETEEQQQTQVVQPLTIKPMNSGIQQNVSPLPQSPVQQQQQGMGLGVVVPLNQAQVIRIPQSSSPSQKIQTVSPRVSSNDSPNGGSINNNNVNPSLMGNNNNNNSSNPNSTSGSDSDDEDDEDDDPNSVGNKNKKRNRKRKGQYMCNICHQEKKGHTCSKLPCPTGPECKAPWKHTAHGRRARWANNPRNSNSSSSNPSLTTPIPDSDPHSVNINLSDVNNNNHQNNVSNQPLHHDSMMQNQNDMNSNAPLTTIATMGSSIPVIYPGNTRTINHNNPTTTIINNNLGTIADYDHISQAINPNSSSHNTSHDHLSHSHQPHMHIDSNPSAPTHRLQQQHHQQQHQQQQPPDSPNANLMESTQLIHHNQNEKQLVLIDTDGGIDDIAAILLALSYTANTNNSNANGSLASELCAVTTVFGNVDPYQAADNIAKVISLFYEEQNIRQQNNGSSSSDEGHGPIIPVYRGAEAPLIDTGKRSTAWFGHGTNGLGDMNFDDQDSDDEGSLEGNSTTHNNAAKTEGLKDKAKRTGAFMNYFQGGHRYNMEREHAVTALIRMINEKPYAYTLVMLGPMTNLALAVKLDPGICGKLKSIVFMGGTHGNKGNATITSEFNFYSDPEAAHIVLGSSGGVPVFMISWDLTVDVSMTWEWYEKWIKKHEAQQSKDEEDNAANDGDGMSNNDVKINTISANGSNREGGGTNYVKNQNGKRRLEEGGTTEEGNMEVDQSSSVNSDSNHRSRKRQKLDRTPAITRGQRIGWFLSRITQSYYTEMGKLEEGGFNMCDAVALLIALRPDVVKKIKPAYVTVELSGTHSRGATVIDWNGQFQKDKNVNVVMNVDKDVLRGYWEDMLTCTVEDLEEWMDEEKEKSGNNNNNNNNNFV